MEKKHVLIKSPVCDNLYFFDGEPTKQDLAEAVRQLKQDLETEKKLVEKLQGLLTVLSVIHKDELAGFGLRKPLKC